MDINQDTEDCDEDYEVSNKVLNSYLSEFSDHNFQPDTEFLNFLQTNNQTENISNQTPENKQQQQQQQQQTEQHYKFPDSFLFHDPDQIIRYLTETQSMITDLDKSFLLNIHLEILNKQNTNVSASKLRTTLNLITINTKLVLVVASILFISFLWSLQTVWILTMSLLVLITSIATLGYSVLDRVLLTFTVAIFEEYLKKTRNLIHYLKDTEIICLANKRRITIEKKQSPAPLALQDTLNYSFRQLVFKHLRQQLFTVRSLNLKLLQKVDIHRLERLADVTMDSFISCINVTELAPVLSEVNDDGRLQEISDQFSLSCISSLIKLIRLVVSEMFKIIQVAEIDSELSADDQILSRCVRFFKKFYSLLSVLKVGKKLDSEMDSLSSVVGLMCSKNDMGKQGMKNKIDLDSDCRRLLSINLRNTLLASLELSQVEQSRLEKRSDTVMFLRNSFEYCKFYLDRVVSEFESVVSVGSEIKENSEENSGIEVIGGRMEENHVVKVCDQEAGTMPKEDVIFEIDMSKIKNMYDEGYLSGDKHLDVNVDDQVSRIANKNLFYELKFALKSKRSEWTRREMRAKRVNEDGVVDAVEGWRVLNEITQFNEIISENGLLENELLKHKSGLRKRKQTSQTKVFDDDLITKYSEPVGKYKYEGNANQVTDSRGSQIFINEFMKQRTSLFNFCEETETVYE